METGGKLAYRWNRCARALVVVVGCLVALPTFAENAKLNFGEEKDFSFENLINRAKSLADTPYEAPAVPDPEIVQQIDYDAHGKLHYKRDYSPFADGSGIYPVTYFHLGRFFPKPVHMFRLEEGKAKEIVYTPDYFDMPEDSVAHQLSGNIGFAGFRLHEDLAREDWKTQDWTAFLGASYFRAIGDEGQYGISARGIAVNTVAGSGEEFPDFTEFYIQPAKSAADPVIVYALLNGPSITGAFAFKLYRDKGVTMEVDKHLFLRSDIARLGIAPLTSMFWFSELNRSFKVDWRPEVHDSDGLELWTGGGERIWRQLNNPEKTRVSSFSDKDPRGFGLMQRDREVTHYLDGVRYHRRPSLWVEPLGKWGEGSVQLVEIPTDDEIHDNIAAFWVPKQAAKAGDELHYRYRLYWQANNPFPMDNLAHVTATRMGRGGEPGKPRPEGVTKFSIDFEGDILGDLKYGEFPDVKVTASRGEVSLIKAEPIMDTRIWRASFDVKAEGDEPVELRMFLQRGDKPLSETWFYQHLPGLKGVDS